MSEDDRKSKSQRKRESEAAQKLGEKLMQLNPVELEKLALPDELVEALQNAAKMRSHGALNRQRQYIGKLMRSQDQAAIHSRLDELQSEHRLETAHLKAIEQWRDRLLDNDAAAVKAALSELIEILPEIDRGHVNQLIRQAKREREQGKPPAAARKLFKYLRQQLFAQPDNNTDDNQ